MSTDPPTPAFKVERFRHWITDVEVSPVDTDPNCKFSARIFVDNELVCNLPWIDYTQSLRWSGLLLCDVSPLSKVTVRLCRSVKNKPRYFNFPRYFVSEVDEETGESTLGLPEAAWVITTRSLTRTMAERVFPVELEKFNAVGDIYGGLEPSENESVKWLFKNALQFANFVAGALPESTAKVSFLIYMKVWELLDRQTHLDDTVRAILHGLTRIRDIVDIASQASSSMLVTALYRSKEPIYGILVLLEDVSVYIFNRLTTNYLAHIPLDEAGPSETYDIEAYLVRLENLQKAFYTLWLPTGNSRPDTLYVVDSEFSDTSRHSFRATADESLKTDWYEILDLLKPANPSSYDLDGACLEGTPEGLLNRIVTWTQNHENCESFMWISGQVGMGKTSIATSLCQHLDTIRALVGSFFCQRDDVGSCDPLTLINNLVCEMSMNCPTYAHEVANAIRTNPKLCNAQLSLQYQGLVKRPLTQLKYISMPMTLVVIVDGLDGCGDADARYKTLQKLYEMSRLVPWLKVIITGRPVGDLQKSFQASCPHGAVIHLQDYDASPDIRAYMMGQLGRLAKMERWPQDSIDKLCTMAQGVFLWATLATKYLKRSAFPALPRLQKVLNNRKSPVTDHFDALYTRVLKTAFGDNEDETKDDYLRCIGSILATSEWEPLTTPDLQYLLLVAGQVDQLTLEQIVNDLGPLLLVTGGGHIWFFHSSFMDFATNSSRSGEFYTQLGRCEADPAAACLELMQRDLRFNICGLESSHLLNSQVPDLKLRIQRNIGPTLKYACIHWIDHFISSPSQEVVAAITAFLEGPQLMYWIEVLSLLGRLDVALAGLAKLGSLELTQSGWSLIAPWAKDAHRFLVSFYDAISASTPHLYVSALAFAPSKSPTAHRMRPYFPNTVSIARDPGSAWHPCVKTITHSHAVESLSVSPDGLSVAVGYPDGSIAIWDLQTGVCIGQSIYGHEDSVASIAFSPNGALVASGSYDTTIRVWSVGDLLKSSHVLSGHSGVVYAVAFSPDGAIIASGSSDKTIWLWDSKATCPIRGSYTGHSSSVSSIAFSSDGTTLVSGSWDKTIRVWSVVSGGQQLAENPLVIAGHSDSVTCIALSPDGSMIASGSLDKTVRVWDSQTGSKVEKSCSSLATHSDGVASVSFSSNGALIVSSSRDGAIHLRNATTLEETVRAFGHSHPVNGVAFSPDGTHIVSGSTDMTTRVWETIPRLKPMTTAPIVGHSSPVFCVAISSDGSRILSGSGDHTVRMWNAQTGAAIGSPYIGHSSYVYGLAFFHDGTRAVSCSIDMTLKLWDTTKHTLISSYQHHSRIRCVASSPDGSLIAFGSDDEQVYLWDPKGRKIINGPLEGQSGLIWSLAFSPDGACLASAAGNTVFLWDTRTHSHVGKPISGHTQPVRSVAFSPCGTRLVSASDDKTVRLWDVETGNPILELIGHSYHVVSVAFSPDGSCIASASFDNTIRLWNSKTGRLIGQPLAGHSKRLRCITFSPDGSYLVSGADDNTLRVWSLDAYFTQANDSQGAFCWPANPYELSSHPHHPGWVTNGQQSLVFWLPPHYQQPELFPGTHAESPHPRTFLDYSKFVHGPDWTAVASDSITHRE